MPIPRYLTREYQDKIFSKKDYTNPNITRRYVDIATYPTFDSENKARNIVTALTNRAIGAGRDYNPSKTKPLDWISQIDYSKGYNPEIEKRFRSENRYIELADYLSAFSFDNPIDQVNYENEIDNIRQYGYEYNALHANAITKDDHESINILEAFDNGDIDAVSENNTAKNNFKTFIKDVGSINMKPQGFNFFQKGIVTDKSINPNDKVASSISVTFNDKQVRRFLGLDALAVDSNINQFNEFSTNTGYSLGKIKSLFGDNAISYNDGKTVITIPKSNLKGIKFLMDVRDWCNNYDKSIDDVSYASYNAKNDLISSDTEFIGWQLQNLNDYYNKLRFNKNEVLNRINGGKVVQSTHIFDFMTERQKIWNDRKINGLLSAAEADKLIDGDNDFYLNKLSYESLADKDVYSDYTPDGTLNNMELLSDDDLKIQFKQYLDNAISEKRVKVSAGISNGQFGTYIKVFPKPEKGALITEGPDTRRASETFVPGLFTNSVQAMFNSSTEGKTVIKMASLQNYGYAYPLNDGGIISKVSNDGAEYYDPKLHQTRYIDRETTQEYLHEDIIVRDVSRTIRAKMRNINGKPKKNYNYDEEAKAMAVLAANELYPNSPVSYNYVFPNSEQQRVIDEENSSAYQQRTRFKALDIYEKIKNSIFEHLNK